MTLKLKKVLLLLLVLLAFNPFSILAKNTDRDSVFINDLNQRFDAGDASVKSSIIDFYIDSIGVISNDFLKFMTLHATRVDFSETQKRRLFDTASTKYNETRIITYLNFFKEKAYVPIVKDWYAKSDKRGKILYESTMFEFGDEETRELWLTNLKNCSKSTLNIPIAYGQYIPVISSRFYEDRKFCNAIIDFLIDHQNQYFVIKDYNGAIEYDDVVYYLSFFLSDRVKGFPDAFIYNKFMRTNENKRYVSFSRHDKDIILNWCKAHRRDYEFEE